MILLVTTSDCGHAPLIEKALRQLRANFFRINTDRFLIEYKLNVGVRKGSIQGYIMQRGKKYKLEDFKSIWWFRTSLPVIRKKISNRESSIRRWVSNEAKAIFVNVFSNLNAFYLNHPDNVYTASLKITQLLYAAQLGFGIPDSILSNEGSQLHSFYKNYKECIYKTFTHPQIGKGANRRTIYTSKIQTKDLSSRENVEAGINYFQEYIQKDIEVRVTVVGNRVFAAEIHSQESSRTRVDWRRYDIPNTPHYKHKLPNEISTKCLELTCKFGLHYAAIDLIKTPQGKYVFLELNPNGLWGWLEVLTGLTISNAIAKLLIRHN